MSDETTKTDAAGDEYAIAKAQIEFLKEKIAYALQADQYVVMHDTSASGIQAELQRLVRELRRCSGAYANSCAGLHRVRLERDAARKELATLREACEGVPAMMADMLGFLRAETGWMRTSYDKYAAEIAAKAEAIRAALDESEATE